MFISVHELSMRLHDSLYVVGPRPIERRVVLCVFWMSNDNFGDGVGWGGDATLYALNSWRHLHKNRVTSNSKKRLGRKKKLSARVTRSKTK